MHTSPLNGGHTQSRTNAHSGSHTYTSTQTVFTCVFPHTSSHNHTGADTSDTLEGTHKLVPAGTTSHAQSYTERGTQPNRATPRSQTRTHTQSDTHSLTTAQKVMTHQDSQTHKPTHSAACTARGRRDAEPRAARSRRSSRAGTDAAIHVATRPESGPRARAPSQPRALPRTLTCAERIAARSPQPHTPAVVRGPEALEGGTGPLLSW